MLGGDLGRAAALALDGGETALAGVGLTVLHAVEPMLAASAASVDEALALTGPASVEWKLDGARIQVHKAGDDVRIFTRNLNDVTDRLPGIVAVTRSLAPTRLVLDGEALATDEDGHPRVFQDTMSEFGAQDNAGVLAGFFFDVLHADGDDHIDAPLEARRHVLAEVAGPHCVPSLVTADPVEAQQFLDVAVGRGHEGVMVKALDAAYDAGRRGGAWRKVKPVKTLDLVVLAAEWGHGRRQGWLSNLHLGARGPDGTFVMVGKTFKGMTDEMLRWQTARFLELEVGRDRWAVHVRPEQVVEIAVDGVQVSRRYPGGVALRFARVRRYRDDKPADQADTIDAVRALLSHPSPG
jgi:DNA ligase-1